MRRLRFECVWDWKRRGGPGTKAQPGRQPLQVSRRVVVVAGQYPNPMYLRAGVRFAAPQSRGRYRGLSCAARSVFACHTYIPPRSAQERLRSLLTGARNSSPLRKRRPPTVPARETRPSSPDCAGEDKLVAEAAKDAWLATSPLR